MAILTRAELTAALAARQLLLERARIAPAEAIRRLTPLQGQHAPAPFIALAARLAGFARADLEAAIAARSVVKSTLMRLTLHLAAADDYPAFAQLARQARLRTWRNRYRRLDEAEVTAELRAWFGRPRTNDEIRERVRRYDGVTDDAWTPVIFARTLLPLVQLPPAGYWDDKRRPSFAVDLRPLPEPDDAATLVLRRYLEAFGPATRKDVATWAGVAQRDFARAWSRLPVVVHRDEAGGELLDLPGLPLPPASTPLPVRFLAHWDQPMLAYDDRARILSPDVQRLGMTLSGATPVTVEGRVAGEWALDRERDLVRVRVTPHADLPRAARAQIREEGERTARFCEPEAGRVEVAIAS